MPVYRRYRRPLPSTKSLTAKILAAAVAAALGIGGLISVEMASGHDPALGPKATASSERSHISKSGSGSSTSSSTGLGPDPYAQQYGDGYSYGDGGGYGAGASGYGSSGASNQPAPVTSGTS